MQSRLLPGMLIEVDFESCANAFDTHFYPQCIRAVNYFLLNCRCCSEENEPKGGRKAEEEEIRQVCMPLRRGVDSHPLDNLYLSPILVLIKLYSRLI